MFDPESGDALPGPPARRLSLSDGALKVKGAAQCVIDWLRNLILPSRDVGMENDYYFDADLKKWRKRGEDIADMERRQFECENDIARLPGHQRAATGPLPPPPTGGKVTMARTHGKQTSPWVYTDWTTGEAVTIGGGAMPLTLTEINATRREYGGPTPATSSTGAATQSPHPYHGVAPPAPNQEGPGGAAGYPGAAAPPNGYAAGYPGSPGAYQAGPGGVAGYPGSPGAYQAGPGGVAGYPGAEASTSAHGGIPGAGSLVSPSAHQGAQGSLMSPSAHQGAQGALMSPSASQGAEMGLRPSQSGNPAGGYPGVQNPGTPGAYGGMGPDGGNSNAAPLQPSSPQPQPSAAMPPHPTPPVAPTNPFQARAPVPSPPQVRNSPF